MCCSTPSRRNVLIAAGAAAAGAAATSAPARAAAPSGPAAAPPRSDHRPNFVIVLADDLGYGALGAFGQQLVRTPHLDRMAEEGIRFTDAYAGSAQCAPSRCALLTGMHTGHARVRSNAFVRTRVQPRLLDEDVTFGHVLQAAGYRTGVFGKWGFGDDDCYPQGGLPSAPVGTACPTDPALGGPRGSLDQNVGDPSHPLQKGFDDFVGLVTHGHATDGYYGNYVWAGNRRVLLPENYGDGRGTFLPDLYLDAALDFIEGNQQEPFCLFFATQLPHFPNLVPSTAPYDDMPWDIETKRYAAQITLLDTHVGMIREKIESLGLAEDTLILFASDNGYDNRSSGNCSKQRSSLPGSPDRDLWNGGGGLREMKRSLYEGGIRSPSIVWGPGIVRRDPQTVAAKPWTLADVLPTLADFAGVLPPSGIDGVSIRSWITGERRRRPVEPTVYVNLPSDGGGPNQEALRSGRYKAVRFGSSDDHDDDQAWRLELYDLEADRAETTDLATELPELAADLLAEMKRNYAPEPFARRPYRPRMTGREWGRGRAG